ncbi:MAG TPA: hypothetical protein VF070_44540 [Streptosporangiaceae bacterium]
MTGNESGTGLTRVTVVTAPACHFCEDALDVLTGLRTVYRLTVEEAAADSPAGQVLLRRHGTGMFPLVLVDGEFFSAGRLPRRKLGRLLAARATAGHAVAGVG